VRCSTNHKYVRVCPIVRSHNRAQHGAGTAGLAMCATHIRTPSYAIIRFGQPPTLRLFCAFAGRRNRLSARSAPSVMTSRWYCQRGGIPALRHGETVPCVIPKAAASLTWVPNFAITWLYVMARLSSARYRPVNPLRKIFSLTPLTADYDERNIGAWSTNRG
jgi:hypothetical protein